MVEDLELDKCEFIYTIKSRSSGLKSDGGSGKKIEVSHRGGLEVRRRYKSGGLSKDLA